MRALAEADGEVGSCEAAMAAALWPALLLRQAGNSAATATSRPGFRPAAVGRSSALPSVLGTWVAAPRGLFQGQGRTPGRSLTAKGGPSPCALGTEALRLRGSPNAGRRVDLAGTYWKEAVWWEKDPGAVGGDGFGYLCRPCAGVVGLAGHVPRVVMG